MFILTENNRIFEASQQVQYFYIGKSGYYVPCSFATATHFAMGTKIYEVEGYVIYRVNQLPEGLALDGSWYYEKVSKEIKKTENSADLQKKKWGMKVKEWFARNVRRDCCECDRWI